MGLTSDELIELSEEVWALINDIQAIKAANSEDGKKISKKEGRHLLRSILKLAGKIVVDVVD